MKNIKLKKRPIKTAEEIAEDKTRIINFIKNSARVVVDVILLGIFNYLIFLKLGPFVYYEVFEKYEVRDRTELVYTNGINLDSDGVENANEYRQILTHYSYHKNSSSLNELKETILNDSWCDGHLPFKIYDINYEKTSYSNNLFTKIEYSKSIKEPKIKFIYKDKYYATNKEGKKGKIAEKAKWPQKETTLVLPKEDDN